MYILTKQQLYDADRYSENVVGLSSSVLMENAGQKMADVIINKLVKKNYNIAVFCGVGSNGGDGFVVARRLKNLGYIVTVFVVGDIKKYKGAAAEKLKIYENLGYKFKIYSKDCYNNFNEFDVIVDAIFGIGFKGEFGDIFLDVAKKINSSKVKVISIDIPTGVYADENITAKEAIKADYTIIVSFLKQSALTFPARKNYGKIYTVDADIAIKDKSIKKCWGEEEFKKTFKPKAEDSNKHKQGKVSIIGGSENMPGAIILLVKACFCSGAGLIEIAAPKSIRQILVNNIFEATYENTQEEDGYLKNFNISNKSDFVVCGPGLGRKDFSRDVVEKVVLLEKPILLDADALYFLDEKLLEKISKRKFETILTPHSGEMARLCGTSLQEVENNRFKLAEEKAKEWNSYLVLKGPFTIISTPNGCQFVNTSGNEGLSKGGSGDSLTGIIAAFFARYKNVEAILNGVYIHGKAADFLYENGISKNSINPSCLIYALKKIIP